MASKSYQQVETAVTWTDSGGDELLDLGGLASGSVKCGSFLDLGAAPRADIYECRVKLSGFDTAPVVGQVVEVWFTESNATTGFDGPPTTDPTTSAEGTMTADQAENCTYGGIARVHSTTASDDVQAKFRVQLTSRYVAPVVVNRTDDALLSTADTHTLVLTPIPQESQ
jgi:hypothetical protein